MQIVVLNGTYLVRKPCYSRILRDANVDCSAKIDKTDDEDEIKELEAMPKQCDKTKDPMDAIFKQ